MKNAQRGERGAKKREWSLSLFSALWAVFTIFTAVIISLSLLIQNFLSSRQYRETAIDLLQAAGGRILASQSETGETAQSVVTELAYEYGVNAYLVFDEGHEVITCAGAARSYSALEGVVLNLAEHAAATVLALEDELVYGAAVTSQGRTGYLLLTVSLSPLKTYETGFHWVSLVTGGIAVVCAFLLSGLIAMLLSKPFGEVTARAKALARGDYAAKRDRRYTFSEISELSDALDCVGEEILRADRVQKELIANVSHDFKTPLTMIKAYASMIKDFSGGNKKKRDEHAQIIIDESDRLAALVTDLLDLSRLQAGMGEETVTVFNLSETVHATAGRFDYLKETHGFRFEIEITEGLFCRADRGRIEQVLYNLIGNAVNYTGEDKRVRIKLYESEGAARFEVIDSGRGIPPEEVDTIWDRYYRSTQTHKRPVQGTGLGLSIVKGILMAHDIPFGVVSEVGKGSCFWVNFPVYREEEEEKKEERV